MRLIVIFRRNNKWFPRLFTASFLPEQVEIFIFIFISFSGVSGDGGLFLNLKQFHSASFLHFQKTKYKPTQLSNLIFNKIHSLLLQKMVISEIKFNFKF